MEQQYAVPSKLGTTYIITDNPPAGATLVQDYQARYPVNKPSLEQRIEVLEKAVSNINERLGIKTDSSSVDLDAVSELLNGLDSSAATKATNELSNSNSGARTSADATTTPTVTSSSATATATPTPTPTDPSSSSTAPSPSADDIAKQLGDLT